MSEKFIPNRVEVDTFKGQQLQRKKVEAGEGISFTYDDAENLIVSASGSGVSQMNITTTDDTAVTYADNKATFSALSASPASGEEVEAEIELPIKGDNGINIDASEDDDALVIKNDATGLTDTITIAVADWSNNTCTKSSDIVTASNTIWVAPAPASFVDYGTAQIRATAQASGTITFTCTTTPTSDISVNITARGV